VRVTTHASPAQLTPANLHATRYDIAVVDYDLGSAQPSGLAVIEQLQHEYGMACVLMTADRDPGVRQQARKLGVAILYKPLAPAKLRAVLAHIHSRRQSASQ